VALRFDYQHQYELQRTSLPGQCSPVGRARRRLPRRLASSAVTSGPPLPLADSGDRALDVPLDRIRRSASHSAGRPRARHGPTWSWAVQPARRGSAACAMAGQRYPELAGEPGSFRMDGASPAGTRAPAAVVHRPLQFVPRTDSSAALQAARSARGVRRGQQSSPRRAAGAALREQPFGSAIEGTAFNGKPVRRGCSVAGSTGRHRSNRKHL
jgi:hypothetical protein